MVHHMVRWDSTRSSRISNRSWGRADQGPGKKAITAKDYESNFVVLEDEDEDAEAVLYSGAYERGFLAREHVGI